MNVSGEIIAGYAQNAAEIIHRFNEIESDRLYKDSVQYFPSPPAVALDIGAGTGRDALWLTRLGFQVTAVEPVAELRQHGMARHAQGAVTWLDDRLPKLDEITSRGKRFDLILMSAVWQHLPEESQVEAIGTLAQLLRPRGRIIMSVRHGPGSADRRVYKCDVDQVITVFLRQNVSLLSRTFRASLQAKNNLNSVNWEWLAFEKQSTDSA